MNMKLTLLSLFVALTTMGSSCINSPFIVAVDLPVEACFELNTGGTAWGPRVWTVSPIDSIDQSYRDHLGTARISDIIIFVTGPYPNGNVSGTVLFSIGGSLPQQFISFDVAYSTLAGEVSLLRPHSGVTFSQQGVSALIAALIAPNGLSNTITFNASGSTAPITQTGVQLCVRVLGQVDAEVN